MRGGICGKGHGSEAEGMGWDPPDAVNEFGKRRLGRVERGSRRLCGGGARDVQW